MSYLPGSFGTLTITLCCALLMTPVACFAQGGNALQLLGAEQGVQMGDALTLVGKNRFTTELYRGLSFYVGETEVTARRVNSSTVEFVVPQLPAGDYDVTMVRRLNAWPPARPGRLVVNIRRVEFSATIRVLISSQFTLFTNPTDSLLLRATSAGIQIDYFGDRDEFGRPTAVRQIAVQNSDGKVTLFELDITGEIRSILADNGVYFTFEWFDGEVLVTVVSPGGDYQLTTAIAVDHAPANGVDAAVLALLAAPIADPLAASATAPVCASVKACGLQANNVFAVVFNAIDSAGKNVGGAWGQLAGPGAYCAQLPTADAPEPEESQVRDICVGLANALGLVCSSGGVNPAVATQVCAGLAVALDVVTIPSGEALAIIAACGTAFTAAEAYCATLGMSAPGGPSLAEYLCDLALREHREPPPEIIIQATAILTDGRSKTVDVMASATGPFPLIDIDFTDTDRPSISSLSINPPRPGTLDNYVASVVISCGVPNTRVELTIVGTDGYTDYRQFTIEEPGMHEFQLPVPGAATGIRDEIGVTVTPPSGPPFARYTYVIFGA